MPVEGQGGPCVLVVDEADAAREAMEALLLRAGCRVVVADDGFDALSLMIEHNPDIVFIGVDSRRLDGYQVCGVLKNNPEYADVPLILLAGRAGLFDKSKGRLVRVDDYFTKPVDGELLLETIARYTGHDLIFTASPP